MLRRLVVSSSFLAFLVFGLLIAGEPSSQPTATYVGSETCQGCHQDIYAGFLATSHGRAVADQAVVGPHVGCEACHGPGSLHVEAGGDAQNPGFATVRDFSKMPAGKATGVCLTCHRTGDQFSWTLSSHARDDVSCVRCHSVHYSKDPDKRLLLAVPSVNDLCLQCHRTKGLGMSRFSHMPLTEGAMTCASCHNPHGTPADKMIRAPSVNELCESCHADKRGPYLWEHAPVREGCLTCHNPHGSQNDKMLESRLPFLCQRCHGATRHPSTAYDNSRLVSKSNRLINRSCVNCHSQIHGSNHPSGELFLR